MIFSTSSLTVKVGVVHEHRQMPDLTNWLQALPQKIKSHRLESATVMKFAKFVGKASVWQYVHIPCAASLEGVASMSSGRQSARRARMLLAGRAPPHAAAAAAPHTTHPGNTIQHSCIIASNCRDNLLHA